ncbi:hypothetical protein [Streptosporangium sp. CA-115845]|uniref:hypothetical protein n=1 Tax=Streptosporangium sp. CA-115845 TaxID=3240071 RepID=UPI003D92E7AA
MSPTGRIRLALSAGALLAVLAAWALGRLSADHRPPATAGPASAPAASTPAGSGSGSSGLAAGADARTRGEKGALAAAARSVALIGSPQVLTPAGRDWLSEEVADPARRAQVRALLDREASTPALAGLRDDAERGVRFALRSVPVALRAEQVSTTQASVNVFVAIYIAGSGQPASLGHGLMRLQLSWTPAGWRVSDYRSSGAVGPIPVGYSAPPSGWQPINGDNLILLSQQLRDLLSESVAPGYVVH